MLIDYLKPDRSKKIGIKKEETGKKILVVFSHPKKSSLAYAIKEAIIRGLKKSNAEVRVQDLYKERFNPLLYDREENDKHDVTIQMKKNVNWAEGIVFVTPLWWANIPAMLKGYFDRVFTEHFSFQYNQAGMPVGLLKNKKALLIGTCDTPSFIAKLSGTSLGFKAVIKGVLKLSGLKDSRFKLFGSVLNSTKKKRKRWIEKTEVIGEKFAGPDSTWKNVKQKLTSFIKAVRINLYSFAFCSVLLGAAIGASIMKRFSWAGFAVSALIVLLSHTAVSFSNDLSDEKADQINLNRTMFNGGTGLLAEGLITKNMLKWGWIVSSSFSLAIAIIMVFQFQHHWLLILSSTFALFIGLEYSFLPIRFSRIGLGEIAAFVAYGVPLMLVGLILQVDNALVSRVITESRFYLISLPISLSVFVTLSLTQIPDTDADKEIGKKSISILLSPKKVLLLSAFALFLCVFLYIGYTAIGILSLKYTLIASALPLLTGVMILRNLDAYKIPAGTTMINIMGMSATTMVLCGIVPAAYYFYNPVQVNLLK